MIKILSTQPYLVNEEAISNIDAAKYDEDYFQYQIESTKRVPSAFSYTDIKGDLKEIKKSKKEVGSPAVIVNCDDIFKSESHFYPQVLETKIHPLVARFFNMGNKIIMNRFKQMNPAVDLNVLKQLLEYKPKHFKYAGKIIDKFKLIKKNLICIKTYRL